MEGCGMVLGTKGIQYYPNYEIPLNYYDKAEELKNTNQFNCYRLIYIEDGNGCMTINHNKIPIMPLTCLCLKEEQVEIIEIEGLKLHLLCLLPTAINSRLTLEMMNSNDGLTISDSQDKQFLLPFIREKVTGILYRAFPVDTGKRAGDIFLRLKELLLVQNDSWPCLTRSYLIELLFLVERTFSYKNTVAESNGTKAGFSAEALLPYLHNHYMNRITINELTRQFNTNRTTLSKEFKKLTGYSVIDYVLKTRIEVAAGMLRDTALKIELIIERVGFHNVTHFNKVFKQYMNCLPHEYRNRFSPY